MKSQPTFSRFSSQSSFLTETNLGELATALYSSLLVMKKFFVAIFISNRDEKDRPSLISSAMVGFEMNGFSSLSHR